MSKRAMSLDTSYLTIGAPSSKFRRTHPPQPKDLRLTPVFLELPNSWTGGNDLDLLDQALGGASFPLDFLVETLAAAIAQGCSVGAIEGYLSGYPKHLVEIGIKELVKDCHPVIFYALERNCVDCVRLLLDQGCDATGKDVYEVPALAFAIMRSKWTVVNPTEVVKTLLGYGADPNAVPRDMWETYLEPPASRPSTEAEQNSEQATMWCEVQHRQILAETLNLSIRYFLHKASQLRPTKLRGMQLAQAHEYVALLKVPYLVVGQTLACNIVVENATSHVGMGIKSPLVPGLSGLGKTEISKQMGALLKVPITVVDCAQMRSDVGLFGSRSGYQGNERGSQLNNHLSQYDGQRSVVFLDEFDKTDQEVRNSLLLLLDSGEYHDRRTDKAVDATKTIWILATNLGDREITKFYLEPMEGVTETEQASAEPAQGSLS